MKTILKLILFIIIGLMFFDTLPFSTIFRIAIFLLIVSKIYGIFFKKRKVKKGSIRDIYGI